MGAVGAAPAPETPAQDARTTLGEVACRYQADEVRPEELPVIAAEALAAGLDTPALCELAGWPRTADTRDIRDMFERALSESGIELPAPGLARCHALRRLAARLVQGDIAPAELATDDWWDTETETDQEREFLSLIVHCEHCALYSLGLDQRTWEVTLRSAALALASSPPIGPGC